jgi:hypothetical protein
MIKKIAKHVNFRKKKMKNIKLGIVTALFAVVSFVQAATYTPSFELDYQKCGTNPTIAGSSVTFGTGSTCAAGRVVAPNVPDVPPISQELANQCFEKLGLDDKGNIAYDIVGIKGHGVVAIDTSPWRAYEHIERLEHICKIVLASGKYRR